ncbi:basic membrane lipoprotein Med (substrate-binding protein (PBP1-ABC) superfamily) [Desulfomicrobium macestii]|uniref:Basic membrane lipoprotein Med (Substrate-binding protein (PBP1-ABC) superfamily) n=1 Tax=Desulfomicrobium macestii TaxID=90731 RepID=A0ABR9H130_9BACT|nr:BMP family protein [Desulfomicrobium macestii]MBE1424404.1 basic membrane lipoprotein Med (substrate-binding protein (PBP1-ABC) superfamily) [Desulfomicrobium macestii]
MKRTLFLAVLGQALFMGTTAMAEKIKVAGIYTQPIQQKWDATLHKALLNAEAAGEIEYVWSEKVSNTDYIRVLREYSEAGVQLIVGEAFGISRDVRKVAKDYPNVAYLMGDTFGPDGANLSVFDNYIHEPCYLMGMIAGSMSKSGKIGMVGGYPIGEVNRLFHAFMAGAKAVNPAVQFKVSFIGSWYDPPKAKEFAYAQVESGVDVLYAERSGVVDAAREKGIIAFGNVNDMNKEENGQGVVVTSALWHMEAALNHAIERVKAGTFAAEDYREWTMMAKGGASLAPLHDFEDKVPAGVKAKIAETEAAIKAGTLVIEINDDEPKSTF